MLNLATYNCSLCSVKLKLAVLGQKIAIHILIVALNLVVHLLYQNMMKTSGGSNHEMKINNIPTNALLRIWQSCSLTMER